MSKNRIRNKVRQHKIEVSKKVIDCSCPYCGKESFLYMVKKDKWVNTVPKEHHKKCVCLECFTKLHDHSKLTAADFMGVPINLLNADKIKKVIEDEFNEEFFNSLSNFISEHDEDDKNFIINWVKENLTKRGLSLSNSLQ